MSRFKDFGSPNEGVEVEPLSFKIYNEEFSCIPSSPGKTLLSFAEASDSENGADSAKAITTFFKKVLIPESWDRFEILAEDPDRLVTVETLAEIIGWIVESYSDRPTQGSGVSSIGE
jgi:hypothetical protein